MTKTRAKQIRGVSAAGLVALLQGAEGIIFSFFGLIVAVAGVMATPGFSAAMILLRESFVILALLIFIAPNIRKLIGHILSRQKGIGSIFFSGTFTAIGNVFYILGVAFAGSSYGVVLTALYPIFSLTLLRIVFKERQNYKVWLGVSLSVLSGFLFIFLPIVLDDSKKVDIKRVLGILFGLVAALGWAAEGIFIKQGIDLGVSNICSPMESLLIRSAGSWVSTTIFIFPISFAFGNTANTLSHIVRSGPAMLIVIIITINLLILRWVHLYAIRTIGPKLTAVIDTNNFLVPAFFAIFLQYGNWEHVNNPGENLFVPFEWWVWLLMIPLFIGVFMVVYFENLNKSDEEIVLDKNI